MKGTARPHLKQLNHKLIIGCQCRQEMGKIPNFTDSERMKVPKTDCALKVFKDKEFYQLGFQVCRLLKRLRPGSRFLIGKSVLDRLITPCKALDRLIFYGSKVKLQPRVLDPLIFAVRSSP